MNTIVGNFVLLATNNTKILVPQTDVGQAQYVSVNTQWSKHDTFKGIFLANSMKDKSFVSLSDKLKPLDTFLQDRFIVLSFNFQHDLIQDNLFWAWNSAQVLINEEFEVHTLPEFIFNRLSPIKNYVIYENEIAYYCNTQKLITYALSEISL